MLQTLRRRWLLVTVITLVVAGLIAITAYYKLRPGESAEEEAEVAQKPQAPPDLQKLREVFASGMQALQKNEGAEAVKHFSSFTFGSRRVEEYRLYYLGNSYQLAGNEGAARGTLASLWSRAPRMIHSSDAAFTLANLYNARGDFRRAGEVYASLARRKDTPAPAAAVARLGAAQARLREGDAAGALYMARAIVIHNPRANEAKEALAIVRALAATTDKDPLPLTASERIERATALTASADPQTAFEELTALAPAAPHLKREIDLQRGIALHYVKRYEDSNKLLEPLTSGQFKTAIPALRYAARNYTVLSSVINPIVIKNVKEKKKVGTTKVRVGKGKKRRTVTKPKYQTVTKQVKLVDLAKKKKKDEYDRLVSERLKDLLSLPLDTQTRRETLDTLIARAAAKNQDDYVRQLIPQVVKIDRDADPALQHFWDKGWAAYARGDLATARQLFQFISSTYTSPNVRRQAEYWYARTVERQGNKEEAMAIYRKLAAAPYADLYARHAISRGATRQEKRENPFEKKGSDWSELAEKEMPDELELAYELTALSAMREATLEIRRNSTPANVRFAEALMADVYNATGADKVLLYRSLKKAWPQLATVEQDTVPVYFLKMYYPLRYSDEIEEHAEERKLDPNLVRALILQESYYNIRAKSPVGATGLMQLMPPTAKEHAKRLGISPRLENPGTNVKIGTFHLRMLIDMFGGNDYLAIASYNAGQGNVMKWRRAAPRKPMDEFIESIPFPETRNYVKRITMLRSAYARIAG
ncbi:MAG TPA: transglycosylase SLT domain-containing protein [Thermoanaerobaculia bacterium]|nr:transglycosylase SLT domain-containing protein [Thermoanaerobaculia bacterium]